MPVFPPVTLPPNYNSYPVIVASLPSQRVAQPIVTATLKPYLGFQDLHTVKPADVLVVLAHPDDEIFLSGTAAKLEREGKTVQFAYVTNGKAGEDVSGRNLSGDALGQERALEVSNAIKRLNIKRPPIILDFMDGETTRYPLALEETLRAVLLQTQPKEVLLFNAEDGVTNHPDHKYVSKTVDGILDTIAQGKTYRDQQDKPKLEQLINNSAVYQLTVSQSAYGQFRRFFPESNPSWKPLQYKADNTIALRVPVSPALAKTKQASHSAHQSQYKQDDIQNMARFYQAFPYEEFIKYQINATLPKQQ